MAEAQRTLLVDLITKWSGIVNDGFAANPRRDQGGLSETYFAWSRPRRMNQTGMGCSGVRGLKLD
jgi:hypothetical protein